MYDLAIIGAGILGTTLAFWFSRLCPGSKIVVLEKEDGVARHTSRRNTGVIHRPFYLDPQKKKTLAQSANLSFPLWEAYARAKNLPFKKKGTIEVALDESQLETLKKYQRWSAENGLAAAEVEILSPNEVKKLEPNLVCAGAIFCSTDVATDFGLLTDSLFQDARDRGVEFVFNSVVERIEESPAGLEIVCPDKKIAARYLINCAGGQAVKIAHLLGVARDLTDLNFRGEYWVVDPARSGLTSHNIYSVPRHSEFPFLDPHWISRWDGRVEIGPTAVPVLGPYAYEGFFENPLSAFRKLWEAPRLNKIRLTTNPEFLRLVLEEWRSSFFKKVMVGRIQKFLPSLRPEYLVKKGLAGIRSSVIDSQGKFVNEVLETFGPRSFHILNFNSPGATGAPAYTAYVIKKLTESQNLDHLQFRSASQSEIWNFSQVMRGFSV
ncbi:MAG: FAD-dependent oxidoreductase [Candidatus Nealsonbacteria bacterium]|nr:FAD-dependent oxidoreductase [Candidatus Nealsonbacteria bacterium]